MKISYDNTIEEFKTAFMLFWRRYALRRTILLSLVFCIAIFLFVNMIFRGSYGLPIGGVGSGLAAGMLLSLWLKPFRARKKLVYALEMSYEEKYTATFGEDTIEVETVVCGDDGEEIAKSEYCIATEYLYSKETRELFLLYVNRALIHVFPKRCMNEQEIEGLQGYFKKMRI
ncbi:MAG: YcxB family protein [Oscillospiraceae bacterium]|nr:YcxB family protein [Oscillospiraceae bacterium]